MKKNSQVVLFTGGRDSTLAAATLMLQDIPVILITADSGFSLHKELIKIRVEELKSTFGELVVDHIIINIFGTLREIAIVPLEEDIMEFRKNLILLGEKLSIHVHAINFCLKNKISIINDGVAIYQERFPEQRKVARQFLTNFMSYYSIKYASPIYSTAKNIDYVKDRLLWLGLSPKSLEGITLFASSASLPEDDVVLKYLQKKEDKARAIISFINNKTENHENHS